MRWNKLANNGLTIAHKQAKWEGEKIAFRYEKNVKNWLTFENIYRQSWGIFAAFTWTVMESFGMLILN